jgi:hypothetical protein
LAYPRVSQYVGMTLLNIEAARPKRILLARLHFASEKTIFDLVVRWFVYRKAGVQAESSIVL